MTVSMVTGLLLQAGAVWLMHVGIRGRWLRHTGALFLAAAVAYHGVTELMQAAWPGNNNYRRFIDGASLDNWMLLASAALLLYSIVYVTAIRRRLTVDAGPGHFAGLHPRWLIAASAPLLALTVAGSTATSYRPPGSAQSGSDYVIGGLADQFLIPLVGLAGAAVVVRHGVRWLLPVLAAECVIMALGGQRRSIVFAVVITLYGLAFSGVRLPRKTLAVGLVAAALLVVSISAARVAVGRDGFAAGRGAEQRSTALLDGGDALANSDGWDGVRNDTVYRLDGNSFGAVVDEGLSDGVAPVGLVTVWDTLRLCVPQFLWPNKLSLSLEHRNEETYLIQHFTVSQVDYIPGVLGSLVTYFGWIGLLLLTGLLAVAFAAVDRFVHRRPSPARLFFGAGMALAVLLYEQGPSGLILDTRGAAALAGVLCVALRMRQWFTVRRPATARPSELALAMRARTSDRR